MCSNDSKIGKTLDTYKCVQTETKILNWPNMRDKRLEPRSKTQNWQNLKISSSECFHTATKCWLNIFLCSCERQLFNDGQVWSRKTTFRAWDFMCWRSFLQWTSFFFISFCSTFATPCHCSSPMHGVWKTVEEHRITSLINRSRHMQASVNSFTCMLAY